MIARTVLVAALMCVAHQPTGAAAQTRDECRTLSRAIGPMLQSVDVIHEYTRQIASTRNSVLPKMEDGNRETMARFLDSTDRLDVAFQDFVATGRELRNMLERCGG